jgi:hypothetical protein
MITSALSRLERRYAIMRNGGPGALRFIALWKLASRLLPEYRMRWMQIDWQTDPAFSGYLKRFKKDLSLDAGRRWSVHQLIRLAYAIPGDTAECGALRGSTSYLICKANEASPQRRTHYIFDSFSGLSGPDAKDGPYWRAGDLSSSEEILIHNLADCRNYTVLKGWIPDRFPEVADRRFSFVHIDVDLYQPTRDSLEFFYPRMNDGGIIIVDDFACSVCPGATRAVEEALSDKPEQMISLSDGGGFLIKGRATAQRASL